MARVAKLDRRGYTQVEIAKDVKLSQAMVSIYLRNLRQRYFDSVTKDRTEMVGEKLEQYREVRREAWDAWERSKKNKGKVVKEMAKARRNDDENEQEEESAYRNVKKRKRKTLASIEARMELVKEIMTREGRLPASEYLRIILDTYEAERQLLGLDEAVKIDLNAQVIDWAQVAEESARADPLTARIEQLGLIEANHENSKNIQTTNEGTLDEPTPANG